MKPFRLGRWRIAAEAVLVVAVAILLGVGQCGGTPDLSPLEANAYKASLAGIQARRATDSVISAGAVIRQRVISLSADNRRLSAQLGAVLDANDSILRLPPDSTDVLLLRLHLAKTTEVTRVFRDSTETVIASVAILLSAQDAEREAWMQERAANAAHIAAQDALIAALKHSRECRILGLPCPTRKQAVAAGVVTTLGVIAAVIL